MRNFIDIIESTKTFSPAFQKWFGNSKAVDASGNPLTLFHGTGESFNSFHASRMVWGSTDAALANDYAQMRQEWHNGNATVMPLYMSVQQPFNADMLPNAVTVQSFFAALTEQASAVPPEIEDLQDIVIAGRYREESGPHYNGHDFWLDAASLFGMDGRDAIRKAFTLLGFDGIKLTEDGKLTFGVFDPRKVKSAIGNSGQYADSDDITEGRLPWGNDTAGCWITDQGKILPCDYESDIHHSNVAAEYFDLDGELNMDDMDDLEEINDRALKTGWIRIRLTNQQFNVQCTPSLITARGIAQIPKVVGDDGHTQYMLATNAKYREYPSIGRLMNALRQEAGMPVT